MLVIPKETGGSRGKWLVLFAVVVAVAGYAAWRSGMRPNNMWASTPDAAMTTVTVDEGEMFPFAIENGTLENSSNTTVRCEVEALLGQVGGAQGGAGGMGAGGAGGGRGGAGGGGGGQAGGQSPSRAATKSRAGGGGASKKAGSGASKTASTASAAASSTAAGKWRW